MRNSKYQRPYGKPAFAFWREISRMMKQIHENVEATKLIREQMDAEKPKQDQAWEQVRQTMAKYDFV